MVIHWLNNTALDSFPPVDTALDDGLLAAGGDLSTQRLVSAYRNGIFPWFSEHDPILWWSPDPRMVLFTDHIKISRSLKKTIRANKMNITADIAFDAVIKACAAPRTKYLIETSQGGWIHEEMISAYTQLHRQGIAHSIEVWHENELVGGLYGVAIGHIFFGESMFSVMRDSSKLALVALCQQLQRWHFPFIDCQLYSTHLATMGAKNIPRQIFINHLNHYCEITAQKSLWHLDDDLPYLS